MDEFTVQLLLRKSSYPFLGAGKDEWIDAEGKIQLLATMDRGYLKNAYNYLLKQRENIERGYCLAGVKFDKSQYTEILSITKDLYAKKINEMKRFL